ncbi:MAG TPA: hypothetical protein VNE63_12365 [Candidatus Acidoferrales bacterium]|nr:hypothetical protein [Candidatus Acidoferrales bacterium]
MTNGATVTWDTDGIPNGNSAVGTISPTSATTAVYTAPTALPPLDPVNIHATETSPAGNSITASATVTITSNIAVSITPAAATIATGQRLSFTATVSNTADTTVTWLVNGVTNGNSITGEICQAGSNPCVPPAGPVSGTVDYLAAASAPAADPVTLTARSHAQPSRSGTAIVVVEAASSGSVSVAISPAYAFQAPSSGTLSTQQFFATVMGSTNQNVAWSVQSGVAGQGCAGAACGSVNAIGIYTAPTIAPSPNAVTLVATSQADPTKSAFAAIALTNGPMIEAIAPSSVMAGAAESFPLSVQGANFTAGTGSASSEILLNGVPRATTCATATICTTMLNPMDVQMAGTLTIQIQNPGSPGALSNPVPMVVEPFDVSTGTISLSSSLPVATGQDIIVVEPTTAAASSPIDVDFVGYLSGGNNCGVQGSPLTVTRPASGSAEVPICVHGNGLDAALTYAFTGPDGVPNGGDIGVTASSITGLLPNMVELQLQISSTTAPGARSLFITTLNGDRAVATGMLEVQ